MSEAIRAVLAGTAEAFNGVPPTAERTERFVDIVSTMNATLRREADRLLTLDSDPRSLETLFAKSADAAR